MDEIEQALGYERGIEKRFEGACQRNGWIASAMLAFGRDYVGLRLEKFSKEPPSEDDRAAALKSLKMFACSEFDIVGTDFDPLVRVSEEKDVPNTLTPCHVAFDARIPVAGAAPAAG